jgi:hypothetical protein
MFLIKGINGFSLDFSQTNAAKKENDVLVFILNAVVDIANTLL